MLKQAGLMESFIDGESLIHTENSIKATKESQFSNGYEKGMAKSEHQADLCSRSVKSSRCFVGDAWSLSSNANHLESKNLAEQNEVLKKCHNRSLFIGKMNRVRGDCILSSLRMKSMLLEQREILCGQKIKECAAHLIFHHILLNSWRKRQSVLDVVQSENNVLNKSVDNLTLQLKVVRLMDTNEKVKLPISEKSVQTLKEEKVQSQKEAQRFKLTLESVTEEKHSLEVSIYEKSRENLKAQNKLEVLETENRILEKDIEKIARNGGSQESGLCDLKLEIVDWKRKLRSSPSDTKWKDKADSLESESWEIRRLIETRKTSVNEYEEQMKKLEDELVQLEREKKDLQVNLAGTTNTLEQYLEERSMNISKLRGIQKKLVEIEIKIKSFSKLLEEQWHVNDTDRKLMYDYTLKNVRNRRFWGNTLYYVVFPLKAVKNLLFGFG